MQYSKHMYMHGNRDEVKLSARNRVFYEEIKVFIVNKIQLVTITLTHAII